MVWVKIVIFCLTFLSSIRASELSQEEINYFNIMDLNNDGYFDFGLSYMGEWWTGQNGLSPVNYIGNYICLLLSNGKLQYQPLEILDEPNKALSFNLTIFDWDFDGKDDVLLSDLNRGDYLKNLGDNKFLRSKLSCKTQDHINKPLTHNHLY